MEDALQFTCPECGGYDLVSVEKNLMRYTPVKIENGIPKYGQPLWDNDERGEEGWYECTCCNYKLRDTGGNLIVDHDDLIKWLKNPVKEPLRAESKLQGVVCHLDAENFRLLEESAKRAGVEMTKHFNKLLFLALRSDQEFQRRRNTR